MRVLTFPMLALGLVACGTPEVPNSAGNGVGFGDYESYNSERARRDAILEGRELGGPVISNEARTGADQVIVAADGTIQTVPARTPPSDGPIQRTDATGDPIDADGTSGPIEVAALDGTEPTPTDRSAISDEQDFEAVSSRETIESDAARIERQRAEYQAVPVTNVPERPNDTGPNIVAYALSTTNAVGQSLYRRSPVNAEARFERACAAFTSPDLAQAAFLEAGGPENDRRGMDPDGDGFACAWDPSPFRTARRASQ